MSTYLVTGAAGFIASKVSEMLLKQDHKVIGIDNLNTYYDIRLKKYRLNELNIHSNFLFKKVDIEKRGSLENIFKHESIDGIINLAARAGVRYSIENPDVYMTTNIIGSLNIFELMKKYEIRKIVLASTSSLYAGQQMPFSESLAVNTPISSYAASKKSAEILAHSYHYLFGLDVSIVRYFTVYGPAGRPDMCIFRFIKWIYENEPIELNGDGTQARDFTYVDDIASGTIKAIKPVGYEIINLGGGKNPISLNYIIKKIEEYSGEKANIEYKEFHRADIKETWADIKKASELIDWQPEISFDEGLIRCMQWYEKNREWVKNVKL